MAISLESLEVFVVAAEEENFTRAARRLHLSQPAVSQHIQALERHFGVNLFDRNGRRVRLSAAGEVLLPLARDLVQRFRRFEEVATGLSGQVVGHLWIGCSTTSGKYVLPRLLAQFQSRYPLVRSTVQVGLRPQVIEWLISGDVHVAISSEFIHRNNIYCREFVQDDIVLVVPADHPWARREGVHPRELLGEKFVLREPSSGTYRVLMRGLQQVGIDIEMLDCVMTLGNSEAIVMAVEEGIGLGFVPRAAAGRCAAGSRLRIVPVEGLVLKQQLYIAYNTALPQPPLLKAFWQFVETWMAAETSPHATRTT